MGGARQSGKEKAAAEYTSNSDFQKEKSAFWGIIIFPSALDETP
jgi:hypothetical protein